LGARSVALEDCGRHFGAEYLGRILVGQVVRAFDGIEGMVFPAVILAAWSLCQRRVDTALSGYRMRTERVDLRDNRHVAARVMSRDCRAQAREPAADDDDVM